MPEELERDQFDDLLKKSSEKLEATPSKNWHDLQSEEQDKQKELSEMDSNTTKEEPQE